jgi:hypothetical protein
MIGMDYFLEFTVTLGVTRINVHGHGEDAKMRSKYIGNCCDLNKRPEWLDVPFKIAGRGIPDGSSALDWFNPEVLPKSANRNWRG